eukprot:scaffold41930_cov19-Prasinocladus_malaysianus.AAC.1
MECLIAADPCVVCPVTTLTDYVLLVIMKSFQTTAYWAAYQPLHQATAYTFFRRLDSCCIDNPIDRTLRQWTSCWAPCLAVSWFAWSASLPPLPWWPLWPPGSWWPSCLWEYAT